MAAREAGRRTAPLGSSHHFLPATDPGASSLGLDGRRARRRTRRGDARQFRGSAQDRAAAGPFCARGKAHVIFRPADFSRRQARFRQIRVSWGQMAQLGLQSAGLNAIGAVLSGSQTQKLSSPSPQLLAAADCIPRSCPFRDQLALICRNRRRAAFKSPRTVRRP